MARTKQTARLCSQRPPSRSAVPCFRKSRAGNRQRNSRSRSNSPDSSQIDAIDPTIQQFSLKFDNQPQCQRNSIKQTLYQCKNCQAYLNYFSEVSPEMKQPEQQKKVLRKKKALNDADKQELKAKSSNIWICQFCHFRNQVPDNITKPKEESPCYLLNSASNIQSKNKDSKQKVIIYCIDISGSMDLVFQNKSRIDAVRQAIRDQIKRLKFQGQKIKIGIVLFGSNVSIKQKTKDHQIPSSLYFDFELITKYCDGIKEFAYPIQTHFTQLEKTISQMTTYGSTALGPGLLCSIQLAGRQRGSKIVLCTDGAGNVGLDGSEFYTKAANYAKEKGVMISILSLKGDNCNLKQIGKLSLSTGGAVLKIDPKLLGSQFNKISKQVVLGTDSNLRIVVNHFFQIQRTMGDQISDNKTILKRDFGNFTPDTELTFNFKVLSNEQAQKKGVSLELIKNKRLPMQIQLTYTNPQGLRYLQVVNDHRELTLNSMDVFNDTDFGLFSSSALQKVSKHIKDEQFAQAQMEIKRFKSFVDEVFSKKQTKQKLDKFNTRMGKLQTILKSKKLKKTGVRPNSFGMKGRKKTKTTLIKKEASRGRGGGRGRGGFGQGASRGVSLVSDDQSQQSEEADLAMLSDQEEEVLYKQLRARSRSNSPS